MGVVSWLDHYRPRRRWSTRAVVIAYFIGEAVGFAGATVGLWLIR